MTSYLLYILYVHRFTLLNQKLYRPISIDNPTHIMQFLIDLEFLDKKFIAFRIEQYYASLFFFILLLILFLLLQASDAFWFDFFDVINIEGHEPSFFVSFVLHLEMNSWSNDFFNLSTNDVILFSVSWIVNLVHH